MPTPTATPTQAPDIVTSPCDTANSVICDVVYRHTSQEWLADVANVAITRPLPIVTILVSAVIARWFLHRLIDQTVRGATAARAGGRRLGPRTRRALADIVPGGGERRTQRAQTLGSVLRSVTSVVVYSTAFVMILGQLGVNLAPLIASASILGVALGFGSQSLVKDVLSGAFMLFEDQYGVGDIVEVDGTSGVVEAVGLRTTRLRDVHGVVWHLRAGEMVKVGNLSQEWSRALLDVTVSYDSDVDETIALIESTAAQVAADPEFSELVLEAPEVWGLEQLGPGVLTIRLVVKTAPLKQWDVARELRRRLRYAFDEAGIEFGAPRQVVSFQQAAPAAAQTTTARQESAPRPSRAESIRQHPAGSGAGSAADRLRP